MSSSLPKMYTLPAGIVTYVHLGIVYASSPIRIVAGDWGKRKHMRAVFNSQFCLIFALKLNVLVTVAKSQSEHASAVF